MTPLCIFSHKSCMRVFALIRVFVFHPCMFIRRLGMSLQTLHFTLVREFVRVHETLPGNANKIIDKLKDVLTYMLMRISSHLRSSPICVEVIQLSAYHLTNSWLIVFKVPVLTLHYRENLGHCWINVMS